MTRRVRSGLLWAITLLWLVLPLGASTWRSTSGNIFHFHPGGSVTAYLGGQEFRGRWWWIETDRKFGYSVAGTTCTVTMEGSGAICKGGGQQQYWTLMSTRGEGDEQEPADTTSWFMTVPTPKGNSHPPAPK